MGTAHNLHEFIRMTTNLQRGHWEAAKRYDAWNFRLAVTNSVLAAIAGTAAFASLERSDVVWIRVVAGVFAMVAAILASVQGAYRSSQKAELHKNAAVKYGILRRKFLWHRDEKLGVISDDEMKALLAEWGETDKESVSIPGNILNAVEKKTRQEMEVQVTNQP
jgi:hypothetical protein